LFYDGGLVLSLKRKRNGGEQKIFSFLKKKRKKKAGDRNDWSEKTPILFSTQV